MARLPFPTQKVSRRKSVDTQTRHALKQDKFVEATQTGLSWIDTNRSQVLRAGIAAVVLLAALIGGTGYYQHRSAEASVALGKALEIYGSPPRPPGAPRSPP